MLDTTAAKASCSHALLELQARLVEVVVQDTVGRALVLEVRRDAREILGVVDVLFQEDVLFTLGPRVDERLLLVQLHRVVHKAVVVVKVTVARLNIKLLWRDHREGADVAEFGVVSTYNFVYFNVVKYSDNNAHLSCSRRLRRICCISSSERTASLAPAPRLRPERRTNASPPCALASPPAAAALAGVTGSGAATAALPPFRRCNIFFSLE